MWFMLLVCSKLIKAYKHDCVCDDHDDLLIYNIRNIHMNLITESIEF